jgi:hypothetical protein
MLVLMPRDPKASKGETASRSPTPTNQSPQGQEQSAPDITEFWKWLVFHVRKDWRVLVEKPFHIYNSYLRLAA